LGRLFITTMEVGIIHTNCYIVMGDSSKEGIVIDPGGDAGKITRAANQVGLKCKAVLVTHGHMDHVGAVGKVAEALEAPVMISKAEAPILEGMSRGFGRLGAAMVSKPRQGAVQYLEPEETISFGDRSVRVVPTPGHTTGSMSFIVGEDDVFCGDLVFQGSVGRTDLRGGSLSQLRDSVRKYIFTLPDSARIYPGHGPSTSVGVEKATNPYLQDLDQRD
jgi:hydroxyacylglutathione hydrolase